MPIVGGATNLDGALKGTSGRYRFPDTPAPFQVDDFEVSSNRGERSTSLASTEEADAAGPLLSAPDPELATTLSSTSTPKSNWKKWGVCAAWAAGSLGSLALRILNFAPYSNAIGAFGIGFCTNLSLNTAIINNHLVDRVKQAVFRQLCLTVLGQSLFYGLTQGFAGTDKIPVQIGLVDTLITLFGTNLAVVGKWLWQEGAVRVESRALTNMRATRAGWVQETVVDLIKMAIPCIASTVFHFVTDDPIGKGFLSFFASFYGFQFFGRGVTNVLLDQINQRDVGESGTRFRTAATVLITTAAITTFFCFVPLHVIIPGWGAAQQLVLIGSLLGFFWDGMIVKSVGARFDNIHPERSREFQTVPHGRTLLGRVSLALKIASPIIVSLAFLGFLLWQTTSVLKTLKEKVPVGVAFGSFVGTTLLAHVVDYTWDPSVRHCCRDKLMRFFFATPSVLGINLLFVYLAGITSLKMNSKAIADDPSKFYWAVTIIAWMCYGAYWARELYVTSSDRIGDILSKFPMMILANGLISTIFAALDMRGVRA